MHMLSFVVGMCLDCSVFKRDIYIQTATSDHNIHAQMKEVHTYKHTHPYIPSHVHTYTYIHVHHVHTYYIHTNINAYIHT